MATDATQIARQTGAFLRTLTLTQRLMLVASVVLVAGVLWLFVSLTGKADYRTLYSGLSPTEAQSISQRLAAENVPSELSSDGATIRVPASQIDKVRLELASSGVPQSGRLGFELFDKLNWAGSDFAEKVNYQRALEGELERTIQSLSGVEAARVHLVLPRESLFTEREREGKAAVLIKLRGKRLSDQELDSITYLVSSAVENLPPENVTVVDADGHVPLLSHGSKGVSRGSAELEAALAEKLVATLEPIVGQEQVKANVRVEYDLGSLETNQETYDANNSVLLSSQTSQEQSTDTSPSGVPGTTSNVPQAKPPDATAPPDGTGNESQGQKTESKTFAVGKTVRHAVQPPGAVKKISAAVLVDDAVETKVENNQKIQTRHKRTPDEMKQIEALASATIGIDTTRGDRLAVENIAFNSIPVEAPKPPTTVERLAPILNQGASLLRYGALGLLFILVYLLVLRPIKKQLVATFRQLPARVQPAAGALPESAGHSTLPEGAAARPGLAAARQGELTEGKPTRESAIRLRETIVERVQKEPAEASRLVENWIRTSES